MLLEGLSPETQDFINCKLRGGDLGAEKRRLQRRLEELETAPYEPFNAEVILWQGMVALGDLPRLMESGGAWRRRKSSSGRSWRA